MRLALAQINAVVGDLDGNRERILSALADARDESADIVLFPELAVTGYPPEDLLLRPAFVRAAEDSLRAIAAETKGLTALVGTPWFDRDLFNACAVCSDGELKALYRKRFLPNYGVFDEERYFASGRDLILLRHGEVLVGPTICEDVWQPGPPATDLALAGAELLVNLSASPYFVGKAEDREEMLVTRARDNSAYLAFCNLVGGQDELLFDGHSVVLDDEGEVLARAPGFEEALLVVDLDPSEAIGRRLRDVRRRALAREREDEREPDVVELATAGVDQTQSLRVGTIAPFEPELEQMRQGARAGAAGLRRQERLRRRRPRALRRDRLGARRDARRRRARAGAGALRLDAVALLLRGHADRRAAPGREPRLRLPRAPDRADGRRLPRRRRRDDGARGREPAGPRPRDDADVALERARLARARDREQVGAVGRLLDALRRPRRRLRADQGRLQDGRLPARAVSERARRAAS